MQGRDASGRGPAHGPRIERPAREGRPFRDAASRAQAPFGVTWTVPFVKLAPFVSSVMPGGPP